MIVFCSSFFFFVITLYANSCYFFIPFHGYFMRFFDTDKAQTGTRTNTDSVLAGQVKMGGLGKRGSILVNLLNG